MGVLARCVGNRLTITGAVGSSDAATVALQRREGPVEHATALGTSLAEAILQSDEALIGLLEAEFPEGLPLDEDEDEPVDPDVELLKEFPELDGEPDD